ncbi:MAG: hypothetical protein WC549_07535 [Actinomycetota bacterium]
MNGGNGELMQENKKKAIEKISHYAMDLYECMQPGEAADVIFQDPTELIVPGQPPRLKRLMIIRPQLHLTITLKKR